MKIIIGFKFENEDTINNIERIFKDNGIEASCVQKNLKSSVEKQLYTNPDTDVVIIDEYLESVNPYSADDILRLVEMNEKVLIIPVIGDNHKGDEYVVKLHNMGIFNAVYSNIDIEAIAELILKPRSRVAAKLYYGISSEDSISDSERTNIPRLIRYVESMGDNKDKIIEVVEYVRKRLSDTDFALFCDRLSDRHVEILSEQGLYAEFIGHRIERKKKIVVKNLNIGKIPLAGKEKEKVIYREVGNDVIAVVSPKRKSGSTFVAINMARAISDAIGLVTGFLHLPDGGRTFTALNLKKHIPDYKSCLQEVSDNLSMTEISNVVSRVSIICENPDTDVLDEWDPTDSLRAIYQAPSPTVLDLGPVGSADLKILMECKKVIVVINDRCSLDELVAFRNNVLSKLKDNMMIYFVFNRFEGSGQKALEEYVDTTGQCFLLHQCKNRKGHLYCNDAQFSELATLMGYDNGHKKSPVAGIAGKFKNVIKRMAEPRVINVATVEIAVGSMNHGAGCTHTAMMIAVILAKKYKVAFLDTTTNGQIACLDEQVSKKVVTGSINGFPYAGVDFYHDITYAEFASQMKDKYDFVVVDYSNDIDRDEYLRAGKRIAVMSVADYRMREIDEFKMNTLERIDKGCSVVLCVPFKGNKELAGVRKLCSGNTVCAIPFCSNPFYPNMQVREFVERLVGIRL